MELSGAIFDMDGVVTDTARTHFEAWKMVFDPFLQEHARQTSGEFIPFLMEDYIQFVDGVGRLDGIRNFFLARQILSPKDIAKKYYQQVIQELAAQKNNLFLDLVKQGVTVFESTIELIKQFRANGIKIAIISASKNCHAILSAAGILPLFDVIVDGNTLKQLKFKGKPNPAIFVEAASSLKLKATNVVVVEDAVSGIIAAKAGHFGLIIGIDRQKKWTELFRQQGADIVVSDLSEVSFEQIKATFATFPENALDQFNTIQKLIGTKNIVLFSDFDGTLTPIVKRPELALLSEKMRLVLEQVNHFCPVIIISGRELEDVQSRVSLDEIYYVGNHGLEIVGPTHFSEKLEKANEFVAEIAAAYYDLTVSLASVKNCLIENKKYSLSVHYRLVKPEVVPYIEEQVNAVVTKFPNLLKHFGKKVFELRPKLDWNKGKTVTFIMQELGLDSEHNIPIYFGDDMSDEDAFVEIKHSGIGILVADPLKKTNASFCLKNPEEVYTFLEKILFSICDRQVLLSQEKDHWQLSYEGFDPKEEPLREALCALGNGQYVTRGAAEESTADEIHYPGTYFAGCYNQLVSNIAGRDIVNEDLVNMPNWLRISFKIDEPGEIWFNLLACEIIEYHQILRFNDALLKRSVKVKDHAGRIFELHFTRFVSMANPNLAVQQFSITSENWQGNMVIRSGLDGTVLNTGVERYRSLNSKHLALINMEEENDIIGLHMLTTQSRIKVAEVAAHRLFKNNSPFVAPVAVEKTGEAIFVNMTCSLQKDECLKLEKIIVLFSSKQRAISESYLEAKKTIGVLKNLSYDQLFLPHKIAWKNLWQQSDIEIQTVGQDQQIVRLHIFHLLQTVSRNSITLDAGVPARGLHGEAYRGHIFWDELFILPFYLYHFPNVARELLLYRYNRLRMARYLATTAGYKGAMYPWQSSSNGDEVTQEIHLNPRSNEWIPDYSHYQRHVNAAIVFNIWQYYLFTNDLNFLSDYGAEMILEIARFWASIATYNPDVDRYEILNVVGPDEYHEKYPDREAPGIDNNAYTNVMAVWSIKRAFEVMEILPGLRVEELLESLQLDEDELSLWKDITHKMRVEFLEDGVIAQFQGYDQLKEFDWEMYSKKYGNIERLDRILKAEGDNTDNYQVSKQADVLMLFYLLSYEDLQQIFDDLNYEFSAETVNKTVNYYLKRTSHGSTLSKAVLAGLMHSIDPESALSYYKELLISDITDSQGGTTCEGIHLGSMAASINIIINRFAGVNIKEGHLHLNPMLPSHVKRLKFQVRFHNKRFLVILDHKKIILNPLENVGDADYVFFKEQKIQLKPAKMIRIKY